MSANIAYPDSGSTPLQKYGYADQHETAYSENTSEIIYGDTSSAVPAHCLLTRSLRFDTKLAARETSRAKIVFHLIYTSRANQEFSAADLKQLLRRSRANNGSVSVTGILLYHDSAFLQALEGDESSVRGVFARIKKDPRHTGVSVLRDQKSFGERRIFGDWSMGFANSKNNAQILKGFIDLAIDQDLLALSEEQAMELFSLCSRSPQYENA
jgi:Sensors of blue-light using FAD